MTSVLRRAPAFRRLWAAGAISLVGDWLSLVAVATLALASGGGAFGLALVFAAHARPGAFVAGMALGGAAAMLGPALALALDAASFALAAILHGTLPAMPVTAPPRSLGAVVRATPRDTAHALRIAAAKPALLSAVLGKVS